MMNLKKLLSIAAEAYKKYGDANYYIWVDEDGTATLEVSSDKAIVGYDISIHLGGEHDE